MNLESLPRLCYIGEVPVGASLHGSALLWRLLEDYPVDRLLIVECGEQTKQELKLPRVKYVHSRVHGHRLLESRFRLMVLPWMIRFSSVLAGAIQKRVAAFKLESVLTVAHGYYWQVAYVVARNLHVPLHLIVHDHMHSTLSSDERVRARFDSAFARAYVGASSRLCISPYMEEKYRRDYGVSGNVLYPARASRSVVCDEPPGRTGADIQGLTGVFAGSLFPTYAVQLSELARVLQKIGGRLLIYGPSSQEVGRRLGLIQENVEFRGMLDSEDLKQRIREEADFLFVPMSFGIPERLNMEVCFPSKLADYTAIGCPLLIRGPGYSAAVRWARENPGVAEVVDCEDLYDLEHAVNVLRSGRRRMELGREALRVGRIYFSHDRARALLRDVLALRKPV